jgi:hypothetical protein
MQLIRFAANDKRQLRPGPWWTRNPSAFEEPRKVDVKPPRKRRQGAVVAAKGLPRFKPTKPPHSDANGVRRFAFCKITR